VRIPRYPDLLEGTIKSNDLVSIPPRTTYIYVKYLQIILVAEIKGVAALRLVVDMLRKCTENSINSMAIYRHEINKAIARSSSGSS
jgi:hypothetical protein